MTIPVVLANYYVYEDCYFLNFCGCGLWLRGCVAVAVIVTVTVAVTVTDFDFEIVAVAIETNAWMRYLHCRYLPL